MDGWWCGCGWWWLEAAAEEAARAKAAAAACLRAGWAAAKGDGPMWPRGEGPKGPSFDTALTDGGTMGHPPLLLLMGTSNGSFRALPLLPQPLLVLAEELAPAAAAAAAAAM